MSSRAIAPVVGASFKTVARDIESVSVDTDAPSPLCAHGLDWRSCPNRTFVRIAARPARAARLGEVAIMHLHSHRSTRVGGTGDAPPMQSALQDAVQSGDVCNAEREKESKREGGGSRRSPSRPCSHGLHRSSKWKIAPITALLARLGRGVKFTPLTSTPGREQRCSGAGV